MDTFGQQPPTVVQKYLFPYFLPTAAAPRAVPPGAPSCPQRGGCAPPHPPALLYSGLANPFSMVLHLEQPHKAQEEQFCLRKRHHVDSPSRSRGFSISITWILHLDHMDSPSRSRRFSIWITWILHLDHVDFPPASRNCLSDITQLDV